MRASELIDLLAKKIDEVGDFEVFADDGDNEFIVDDVGDFDDKILLMLED